MFRLHPTFFDVFLILLSVFMLITVLLAKNVQQEYRTKVDLIKKAVNTSQDNGDDAASVSLTVVPDGKEAYRYILSSKKTGEIKVNNVKEIKNELSSLRPGKLNLRIDKSVPTGITQELLYDAQELGILPYLSLEKR